jgi:hypothetical protein
MLNVAICLLVYVRNLFFFWRFLIYLRVVVVHPCPSTSDVSTEDCNAPEAAMTDLLPSMKIVFGLDT